MSNEQPAAAAPAPATTEAAPVAQTPPAVVDVAKPLTAPLVPDKEDFLKRARERSGLKPRGEQAKPATPAATVKQATVVPAAPTVAEPPKVETPAAASPPAVPADELASRLAQLTREQRRFTAEQEKWATQRTEETQKHAEKLKHAETLAQAQAAVQSGDWLAAAKAIAPDVDPNIVALRLLEQLQLGDPQPISAADVEKMVAAKLESQRKADEAKRTEEEKSRNAETVRVLEGARENYLSACAAAYNGKATDFPLVGARGIPRTELLEYVEAQRDDSGRPLVPDPEQVVAHFEKLYQEQATRAGFVRPAPAAAPAAKGGTALTAAALQADGGGRASPEGKRESLDEKRARIKQRLRLGGQQA
jgi:hypothetical protein